MSFGAYDQEKSAATMAGPLQKSGAFTHRAVTRFYICHKGMLVYYETEQDAKPKKVIDVQHSKVETFQDNNGGLYGFMLQCGKRSHTLYAKSPEEVDAWVDAIRIEGDPTGAERQKSNSKKQAGSRRRSTDHVQSMTQLPVKQYSRAVNRLEDVYEIGEELGSGGFSVVKRGTCRADGTQWALKMIKQSVFAKNRERTEEEVEVLAGLSHPNIVHFREVVRTPKFYVIVMEILEGGELFDRIVQREKYDEQEARNITRKILSAVKYLHDNNIVHRDLKPENLIFNTKGDDAELKLTDFGFATVTKKNQLTDTCGTPEYVAPEILDEKGYSLKVDMWSVGVIVYILLCGFPPFHGKDDQELFDKICECKYEFVKPYWNRVSNDAKEFIRALLCLDPDKRMSAADALQHPWLSRGRHGSVVENADLSSALVELKRYNATRKFRKAVLAVLAANRIRSLMKTIHQSKKK